MLSVAATAAAVTIVRSSWSDTRNVALGEHGDPGREEPQDRRAHPLGHHPVPYPQRGDRGGVHHAEDLLEVGAEDDHLPDDLYPPGGRGDEVRTTGPPEDAIFEGWARRRVATIRAAGTRALDQG